MSATAPAPLTAREAYPRVHRLVWWLVRRRGVRRQDRDDLAQDAAVLFLKRFADFDGDPAHLRLFAGFMVRNADHDRKAREFRHARRLARAAERMRLAGEAAPDPEPAFDEPFADPAANLDLLRAAVAALPDDLRELFARYYGWGRPRETLEQLGRALGVTREAVRKRLKRVRERLHAAVRAGRTAAVPQVVR